MSKSGKKTSNFPKVKILKKVPTGISGLDQITGGGIPAGRPTLVCGGTGCGKTLMSIEFIVRGALEFNEPGVFMAFEEKVDELAMNVASLGFDLEQLQRDNMIKVDYVHIDRSEIEETGEYDLNGLFIRLGHAIDKIGAKRVVLDTIENIFSGLDNQSILRTELRRLFNWLKEKNVTAMITGERGTGTLTRQGLEEYVSDCVILLDHRTENQISTRLLRIVKYRGTLHGTNEYPFLIDQEGISVLPITSSTLDREVSTERVPTGIQSLDQMLGGKGFFRGSSILVSGTAGTGKTSIGAHFAHQACKRNERCVFFSFEESPQQIIRNMRSIGIDMETHMKIKNVKVEIKASGPLSLPSDNTRTVEMPATGDITIDFDLAVKAETGIGKIIVTASSAGFESSDEIEIDVRNPNPKMSQVTEVVLAPGKSWSGNAVPIGITGTNTGVLEVSSIPAINLGYRLTHLMEYPHGCIEQTTSSAFPQLYLDVVRQLDESEKARIKYNVTAAIERLKTFMTRDGGFAYWPGNDDSDSWGSTYAGNFLVEAEAKGYYVPSDMLKRWKKYQRNKSLEWRKTDYKNYYNPEIIQAYRLYTLALAGSPELSAMNRLRETPNISLQSRWMLAAAYVKAGQPEAGKKLIENLTMSINPYQEMGYSYGSDFRDKAIILETLVLLNERTKGFELVREIAKKLSSQNYWMSTQTIAFCLKSVGMYVGSEKPGELKYEYTYGGKSVNAISAAAVSQVPLAIKGTEKGPLKVTNETEGSLFVQVIMTGIPARGVEEEQQKDLVIQVNYSDTKFNPIDVTSLSQGTEFLATVTVKNPGLRGDYMNMALSQIFPSGWEINNLRITDDEGNLKTDRGDYQDIRDDRVYTYFNLGPGSTRTFTVSLTASYAGKYYLPAMTCEAMYDNTIYARTKGFEVDVVKPVNQ